MSAINPLSGLLQSSQVQSRLSQDKAEQLRKKASDQRCADGDANEDEVIESDWEIAGAEADKRQKPGEKKRNNKREEPGDDTSPQGNGLDIVA